MISCSLNSLTATRREYYFYDGSWFVDWNYHSLYMVKFHEATSQAFASWQHLRHRNWLSLKSKFQVGSKSTWKMFLRAVNVYHSSLAETKSKRDALAAAYAKYPKITLVPKKKWETTKGIFGYFA